MQRAITELIQIPEVRQIVYRYHDNFNLAEKQIEQVAYYKELHDLLHTIHSRCFSQLVNNTHGFPSDVAVKQTLELTIVDLEGIVEDLKDTQKAASAEARDRVWINEIMEIVKGLRRSIDNADTVELQSKIGALRSILNRIPTKINQRLNNAAYNLQVPDLVTTLTLVCESLRSHDLEPILMAVFEDVVDHFTALGEKWQILVDQHTRWEDVESRLRIIDTMLRIKSSDQISLNDLTELNTQWPSIKQDTLDLLSEAENSANRLYREADELELALDAGNLVGACNHYGSFRSIAGQRFYKVDKLLKDRCDQMRLIGQRLKPLTAVSS